MSNKVKCPNCGKDGIEIPSEPSSYDWNSGVSFKGLAEAFCIFCESEYRLEADITIDTWEVEVVPNES